MNDNQSRYRRARLPEEQRADSSAPPTLSTPSSPIHRATPRTSLATLVLPPPTESESPVSHPSKQRFTLEPGVLAAPRVRQQVGCFLNGWSRGQHPDTKRNRYLDLHHFAAFVLHEDVPHWSDRDNTRAATVMVALLRAQPGHDALSGFVEWLTVVRHYSAQTIIRKLKTLRLWARYLYERRAVPQHLDEFPIPSIASLEALAGKLSEPSQPSTPTEHADVEHLSTEDRAHAHQVLEIRNEAIEGLLAHSSLDIAQLLELTWSDVDFHEQPMLEDDDLAPLARVQVSRRDGHRYWRQLPPHATDTMRRWKRAYVSHFCAALPDRPVFSTLSGKRLCPSRLYQLTGG